MSAGVRRVMIGSLVPSVTNIVIVGVIVAQQSPKTVNSKMKADEEQERAVWNFTLRDSPYDTINASYWGSALHVNKIAQEFHVSDVVEFSNPRVAPRPCSEQEDRYRPAVSSALQLMLSEAQNELIHYQGQDRDMYRKLLHFTTKPPTDFFTLADVHTSGSSMRGELINVLAAVREVAPLRAIRTKDGRNLRCRDVVLMDQTNTALTLHMWNNDSIDRADTWLPRQTVLFVVDVKMDWDKFRNVMAVTDGPKTIITEDPDTPEAHALREYGRTAPLHASALLNVMMSSVPDPTSIRTVMTVQQVADRSVADSTQDDTQFTALIYCLVSQLDIDGTSRIITIRCGRCHSVADVGCENMACPVGSGAEAPQAEISFDIRVSLTDHTGTLENCRLVGSAAEKVLGCTVMEFQAMSPQKQTELKWTLLQERCAARVAVLRSSYGRRRPLISLLACTVADPVEAAARIPIF